MKKDGRRFHQRTSQGQQNAERDSFNSYYSGGYHTPAAAARGGGGHAASFYNSAWAAAAAGGRMPRQPQYYLPQPRSLQGFVPHPRGFDDVRSSAIYQHSHPDEEERRYDESDAEDPSPEWRDGKSGPRDMESVPLINEKESIKLPSLLHSEVASMSFYPPLMDSKTSRLKAERAAGMAYQRLLTENRGVTLWKVVQATLLALNSDSLESLGLSPHDVPSLRKLMILEEKINAYIHCHVAVRKITTLHDLNLEICQNEGVKDFNDLKLGPISFHPLVGQYFAFPAGVPVCRITIEDVLSHMSNYMDKHSGDVQVDDFLSFMTKKRCLPSPQHLGVRLRNFGMYVSFIRREKRAEKSFVNSRAKLVAVKETALKKEMPGPSITGRIDSFLASVAAEHAQNTSLSSDDEDRTKTTTSALADRKRSALVSSQLQPTSCPYPSAAEERIRVCTKSPSDVNVELLKTEYDLSKQELGDFVAAWRGFCQKNSVSDVLMQMLFANGTESKKFSNKKKKKLAKLFKEHPAIGILNTAIYSMKAGHWNSLYDVFEEAVSADANETKGVRAVETVDRIEVVCGEPHHSMVNDKDSSTDHVYPSIDTLTEILAALETMWEALSNRLEACNEEVSQDQEFGSIVKKIMSWEKTLLVQLLPKNLNITCQGSSNFVDSYVDMVSKILSKFQEKESENNLKFVLPENRVKNFLHQASTSIENFDGLPENVLSKLLAEQFHLHHSSRCCLNLVKRHLQAVQSTKASSFLLFYSGALLGTNTERLSKGPNEMDLQNSESLGFRSMPRVGLLGSMTSVDAKTCLFKAPMLCNILEWSQWDSVFAPTLGPLLDWLERENSSRELVCLVTRQGSILRIDGSATVESLLAVAVKGLGKETTLQLISLVATYGGADRVPKALVKSYLSKAIGLLVEKSNVADKKRRKLSVVHTNDHLTKRAKQLLSDDAGSVFRTSHEAVEDFRVDMPLDKFSQALQFVLDVFIYLPSEFVAYVSSMLVPALCGIVPNAPVAMLNLCSSSEHRMKLHEVGLVSGIAEWVRDFKTFFVESHCSINEGIIQVGPSTQTKDAMTESSLAYSPKAVPLGDVNNNASRKEDFAKCDICIPSIVGTLGQQRDSESFLNIALADNSECYPSNQEYDANEVISRIRKEEFGMDLELPSKELNLLTKQHARVGRALQCLSRELYSKDSHYVLELVQNADDNQYGANVDAMLVFMLQQERVVVVNNELGFSPANIRALCDVGSSTKTGSSTGYIGQKGIGFKSVFRITDSPQIHSNGFHVKFDVSEGNIGFVLPTVISPINDWHKIKEILSLIESLTNRGNQTWNTCMVLPLKDTFMNGCGIEILSRKLGDIHPSLLLFLRRLSCISIKDDMTGTMRVMQRYDLGDGLVKVSDNEMISLWVVVKQYLDTVMDRPGVKTTEIALAFPLQEVSPGEFGACSEYQQVFAFLPLRSYGLRFIVQGDFVLPSSREDLDLDSPWNQWLLSEIPSVCVKALEAFKRLSCFKQDIGKAASVFMSYLPLEGEVQGFFSSLPRMIFRTLRTSSCLPVEGRVGEWALPCILLGGWNESVRNLLPEELLWEVLGLRYLHREVLLSSVVASELGLQLYGSKLLVDFLEALCARKNVLVRMGPRWIRLWLVAFHQCSMNESQKHTHLSQSDVEDREYQRLQTLRFIPLSNGSYTSLSDGPLWLPSVDATSGSGKTGLLNHFPLLYAELKTVDALLLCPECINNSQLESAEDYMLAAEPEERAQLYSVLRRLGIGQISEHKVVTSHVLPSMTLDNARNKSDLLLMQCLAFVMVHLQFECKDCSTEGPIVVNELRKNAIVVTSKGHKRVTDGPLHFGVEFGCPVDVRKILQGLRLPWTEVDAAYLQTFQGWSEEVARLKWRSFFKQLGVTDFVKLELVEKKLHDKATSVWKDIAWEDCENLCDIVTVRDWECPEAVQILEELCDPSSDFPEKLLQCAQFLSSLDLMWEETYSECEATYWRETLPEKEFKGATLPSFILRLRSFAWIQSSFDGKLHHPKELFHQCSAVESLLGEKAPYARPQLKSTKLASALGLQTVGSAPNLLHVFKLWNQLPIQLSVGQMTKLYTCIWNEMSEDKDLQQFLQTENSIFVPEFRQEKSKGPVLGRFVHSKHVVWRDETGFLSLIVSTDNLCKDRVLFRALNTIYPTLQPFFVNQCHVQDSLCFKEYCSFLKIVAETHSPQTVLDKILKLFAMWSEDIKSGLVSSTDLSEWKELLHRVESQVLPTVQNKWVSLHGSEGIICWCDDEALGQMFLGSKGIHYICVGKGASSSCFVRGADTINAQALGPFLQAMNIPPLSKVVKREPIAYGAKRSKELMELLNWVVPYVQRYLQKMRQDVYYRLQQDGVKDRLNKFACVVCDQLFFRYRLPGEFCVTSERLNCSYLLEDDVFYATQLDDFNHLFLEFSKLFFDGVPNAQLANFLHLIALSIQSGSSETEIEALLASQGIGLFQEGDEKWTFVFRDCEVLPESAKNLTEPFVAEFAPRKAKRFLANAWPPRSSRQAVSSVIHRPSHADRLAVCQRSLDTIMMEIEMKKGHKPERRATEAGSSESAATPDIGGDKVSEDGILPLLFPSDIMGNNVSFPDREQLSIGAPNEQHQELTGRLGEAVAFNHLLGKHGPEFVTWMNAEAESGLPYDIVIKEMDGQQKLVEVKTTWSEDKDWFEMTQHEWELACRLGDRFVIVRVFLAGGSSARFLWLPHPSQLCQQRLIKLALVLPLHHHADSL